MSGQADQEIRQQFERIVQQSEQMALLAEQDEWQAYHEFAQQRHGHVVDFFQKNQLEPSAWLAEAIEKIRQYDAVGQSKLGVQQKEIQIQLLDMKKAMRAVDVYNKM